MLPPSYEKDQSAVIDAAARARRLPQEVPRLAVHARRRTSMRTRGAEAPRRPRGLRRALLPQERSPEGGGACASRGRSSATPARAASPSCCTRWARPTCTWTIRCARRRRSRASSPSTAARRRPGGRSSTSSTSPSATAPNPLPDAATAAGAPAPPPMAEPPQWLTATAGLRELVARGRAHYAAGEYAEAVDLPDRGAARARRAYADVYDMLGVIYHQEGRLAEAEEMFRERAAPQPGLHRGGAEPGRHLQRPRQVRRGEDDLRAGDGGVQARAARAGPVRQGQDRQHARRDRRRLPRRRRCTTRRSASTSSALALCPTFVDIRTELGNTLREMGDLTGAIRELERVRAESPRFVAGRPPAGARLLRGRPARGRRRRMARRAGGRAREPRGARCTSPCSDPAAAPDHKSRRPGPDRETATLRAHLHAVARALRRRGDPRLRARPAKATHTFVWIEKRGLTTFDAIARSSRRRSAWRRATSATPA